MARNVQLHRCAECGHEVTKWVGRCPECQAWGSIQEASAPRSRVLTRVAGGAPSAPARPIAQVDVEAARARGSGISELDRVLGGGVVPGAVILLAGEPGVGKSTLLLEVAYCWAKQGGSPSLYVTGEESAGQVRLRAERTGNVDNRMYLAAESDLGALADHIDTVRPGLLIVDSVQTITTGQAEGSPGGVTQVRAVTTALVALAKERGLPVLLVGHVTKEGAIAGPRVLEHLVDVVLHFEGDRHSTLRMLRGVKNRFGPADEVGCFELRDDGIVGVTDPSGLFTNRSAEPAPGTAVTVTMEGKRPLLGEVQALIADTTLPAPRRAVSGLDFPRVAMVLAVVEKRLKLSLGHKDVFVATVGGMRMTEPAADLALALAVVSSKSDRGLPGDLVAIGEVGLAGEVRRVTGVARRLAEAARLGFRCALVPPDCGPLPDGIRAIVVTDVRAAIHAAGIGHS